MLNLTVDPHGAGDYCTIGEALEAIPYGCEATIVVGEGTYNERLSSDKRSLAIRGEGEVICQRCFFDGEDGAASPAAPKWLVI